MDISFSIIGNFTGAVCFSLLAAYLLRNAHSRKVDRALILASLCTVAWLIVLGFQAYGINIPFDIRYAAELIRTGAWFLVLYAILGITVFSTRIKVNLQLFFGSGMMLLISSTVTILIAQLWFEISIISGRTLLILNVLIALAGILLLEQIWRNSALFTRSGIKYLSLAIAAILAYDFIMYSDALLFNHLSSGLWDARGAINALATPLIATTLISQKGRAIGIHVSRQMIFHTSTFVVAGIYLIFVSAGGYYINVFGGDWGEALRVLFLFCASIFLILVLSSPTLRARTMVFISKNFFDYKYDYRDEWIKSTSSLQNQESEENGLPLRSTKTLAELVQARSGAIWVRDDEGNFVPRSAFGYPPTNFDQVESDSDLVRYFEEQDWIINLIEYLADPEKYGLIELPTAMLNVEQPWLIIPLYTNNKLSAIVLLSRPNIPMELNWENYDLLKIVAQQACSYLEQQRSEEQLAQSRQFEAVTQTSAFLVHDIKTIIAQLSLLVKNAPKHKHNPDFIDDMISTTEHSVEKMEHLLGQIRNPNQVENLKTLNLSDLLERICHEKRSAQPAPMLAPQDPPLFVEADPTQLSSAIEHITQNAIEACDKSGSVEISTKSSNTHAFIFIQDSGVGMTPEFIKNELFKPFSSTKGLTGMGIGVYQSRQYLRKINGTLKVTSEPGIGTCFTISVPLVDKSLSSKETKEKAL